VDLNEFVLTVLPPPARLLEVGCGAGERAVALASEGYDVLAIDPQAPEGPLFRQVRLEEFDDAGPFDIVLAERVLHHVDPLDPAFRKIARLAPVLVLEEFAWDRIDEPTQDWYERQHRMLRAAGSEPNGPPDVDQWRVDHPGLNPSQAILDAAAGFFEQRQLEWRPCLYRWLGGPASEVLERTLIEAEAIQPAGFRYVGDRR
jgi:SAM-dependent methyltransferase